MDDLSGARESFWPRTGCNELAVSAVMSYRLSRGRSERERERESRNWVCPPCAKDKVAGTVRAMNVPVGKYDGH